MIDYMHLVEAAKIAFQTHHDTLQHIGTTLQWVKDSIGFLITLEKLKERFWPKPKRRSEKDLEKDRGRQAA